MICVGIGIGGCGCFGSGCDVEALEIKADTLRKNLQKEACAFT
ncbi:MULTISPECIES: hypothetical protein [unclassified Bartonella]